MNQEVHLNKIRTAEARSHTVVYNGHDLYAPGSWLAKPVRTVMDILPLFAGYSRMRGLDLGCGVGRNCIAVAQAFRDIPCFLDCVDILPLAIEKLLDNARKYQVSHSIRGIVSSIDEYQIPKDSYDLIMAISALEHVDSKEAFLQKLLQIKDGIRENGIACLIINCDIAETDKVTKSPILPQFEVNFSTSELKDHIENMFSGWQTLRHTVTNQQYDIPREHCVAELETDVVTYVVRKKEQHNGEG